MQQVVTRIAKKHKIDLSQPGAHLRINNKPYMPLVIECIGKNLISVAHYYTQNGDLCADPDVVFLVGCDGEWYPVEWTTPQMMLMGRVVGGYQRYVEVDAENGTWLKADLRGQRDLAIFCNQWADNIKMQGFVEASGQRAAGRGQK